MSNEDRPGTYEVEVATIEEFLRILSEREAESREPDDARDIRRDVFIARLMEERGSRFGFPSVRRCVVASFIYGLDVISYRKTTSSVVELPELTSAMEERQRGVYKQVRSDIFIYIMERFPQISVYEGSLR